LPTRVLYTLSLHDALPICLLHPPVRIRPSDLDDTGGTIDVALLEREQLRGSKPSRGREHDHRPEHPEPLGDRPDLRPGIERPLLDRKSTRLNSSHEWISYA